MLRKGSKKSVILAPSWYADLAPLGGILELLASPWPPLALDRTSGESFPDALAAVLLAVNFTTIATADLQPSRTALPKTAADATPVQVLFDTSMIARDASNLQPSSLTSISSGTLAAEAGGEELVSQLPLDEAPMPQMLPAPSLAAPQMLDVVAAGNILALTTPPATLWPNLWVSAADVNEDEEDDEELPLDIGCRQGRLADAAGFLRHC
jgi:hypothetical protein